MIPEFVTEARNSNPNVLDPEHILLLCAILSSWTLWSERNENNDLVYSVV